MAEELPEPLVLAERREPGVRTPERGLDSLGGPGEIARRVQPEPVAPRPRHLRRERKRVGAGQDSEAPALRGGEVPGSIPEAGPSRTVSQKETVTRPRRLDQLAEEPTPPEEPLARTPRDHPQGAEPFTFRQHLPNGEPVLNEGPGSQEQDFEPFLRHDLPSGDEQQPPGSVRCQERARVRRGLERPWAEGQIGPARDYGGKAAEPVDPRRLCQQEYARRGLPPVRLGYPLEVARGMLQKPLRREAVVQVDVGVDQQRGRLLRLERQGRLRGEGGRSFPSGIRYRERGLSGTPPPAAGRARRTVRPAPPRPRESRVPPAPRPGAPGSGPPCGPC